MSTTLKPPTVPSEAQIQDEADNRAITRAEKWFFAGVIITGSILVGPIGFPVLFYGLYQLRKIEKEGRANVRPWHVSVIGAFAIIDAAANFVGWSFCTFAAQTGVSWSILRDGYGYGFDGFYYNDYGSGWPVNGVSGPGEQSYIYMAMLVVWPMRLCAAWAFLQMKSWGLRWMITSTWLLVLFWVGWTTNGLQHFEERFGATGGSPEFGYLGYWIFNSVFIFGPIAMVPYLYTVKPSLFNKR